MPAANPQRSLDELAQLGEQAFEQHVRRRLRAEDDQKFVAIDITTGDYELDEDDYEAVSRLRSRRPSGEIWLGRVGQRAAYRMGRIG